MAECLLRLEQVAWAAESAVAALELKAQGKNPKHKGSVANMSLGGGKSQALDDAVNAATEDGLHFAVAVRFLPALCLAFEWLTADIMTGWK